MCSDFSLNSTCNTLMILFTSRRFGERGLGEKKTPSCAATELPRSLRHNVCIETGAPADAASSPSTAMPHRGCCAQHARREAQPVRSRPVDSVTDAEHTGKHAKAHGTGMGSETSARWNSPHAEPDETLDLRKTFAYGIRA